MAEYLNRFTDLFEKYVSWRNTLELPLPQEDKQRAEALKLLQERDDGLNLQEIVAVINHLAGNHSAVVTYLALEGGTLRTDWLRPIIRNA